MQKLGYIFVSLVYLTLSVGVHLNFHYCMGQMQDVSLYEAAESCCCGDTDGIDKNCCDNETLVLIIDTEQQSNENLRVSTPKTLLFALTFAISTSEETLETSTIKYDYRPKAPPLKEPAWVMYCSPIYYG